ncbi:hypothetical protein GRAQ_02712 [Rahnella aquatilis CIP 78.65 = ATCC 33071]|nr:hypothetical protein GRAQ_02712 [Rahnella aquatilis CIP 78.65 = ATCC 33071]
MFLSRLMTGKRTVCLRLSRDVAENAAGHILHTKSQVRPAENSVAKKLLTF